MEQYIQENLPGWKDVPYISIESKKKKKRKSQERMDEDDEIWKPFVDYSLTEKRVIDLDNQSKLMEFLCPYH